MCRRARRRRQMNQRAFAMYEETSNVSASDVRISWPVAMVRCSGHWIEPYRGFGASKFTLGGIRRCMRLWLCYTLAMPLQRAWLLRVSWSVVRI